jgi:hypothetical protein
MRGAMIALALTLFGCGSLPCSSGTLFLNLSFLGAAQGADTLDLSIAIDGQLEGHRIVHRGSGQNDDSVSVDFASGYPAAHAIVVKVVALAAGSPLATAVDNFTAARGCTMRSLTLADNTGDLASPVIVIGEPNLLTTDDSGNANILSAQQATLRQTAAIESLSFYVSATGGELVLGIYDATGASGSPGTLVAQTTIFTPTIGWNTKSVTTPVSLASGTYWLAYLPSSNVLQFPVDRGSGINWFINPIPLGPLPSTFPSGATSETSHWSFYATLQ